MLKRLTICSGIIILLLALSQVLLPQAIAEGIAGAVKTLTNTENVTVKAEKFPAPLMLAGDFDKISLRAAGARIGKLTFDEFDVRLEGVRIDVWSLLQNQAFALKSARDAEVQAVISERELASLINQKIKGAKDARVTILPDKITVRSVLSLGGMLSAEATLTGKIVASDNRILFATEEFHIDNPVIGKLGGAIFTDLVLADFKELPFAVQVKKIALEAGKVRIQADNRE